MENSKSRASKIEDRIFMLITAYYSLFTSLSFFQLYFLLTEFNYIHILLNHSKNYLTWLLKVVIYIIHFFINKSGFSVIIFYLFRYFEIFSRQKPKHFLKPQLVFLRRMRGKFMEQILSYSVL